MKLLTLCAIVVAIACLSGGSSAQSQQRRVVYSPSTEVSADRIWHDSRARTTYARGQVRIVSGNSTITADEADLLHLKDFPGAVDLAVDLRGSVRVVLTPSIAK